METDMINNNFICDWSQELQTALARRDITPFKTKKEALAAAKASGWSAKDVVQTAHSWTRPWILGRRDGDTLHTPNGAFLKGAAGGSFIKGSAA